MPATSPPTGSDTPAGSPLGDARALEEMFRAHYAGLTDEAKQQLEGATSFAPRVVEGAFRHAWEERQRFQTPQDVEAFLHEEVKHGAARERSRRAGLQRFEARQGGTGAHAHATAAVNVDESWAHVARALRFVDTSDTAQSSADALRHDAAGHVAQLAKKRSWKGPIAVGVIAAVLVGAGIWYVQSLGNEGAVLQALASSEARPHIAATAQMAIVSLDDGTKVTLAPESKLIVPKQFGELMPIVKIEGAATFEVATGKARQFQIRAANAKIIATGTVITVRAFPADSYVVVRVKTGAVRVEVGDSVKPLTVGNSILVEPNGKMRDPTPAELQEATTWEDHSLTISNKPLRVVLTQLHRWYGLDIKVLDTPLLDRMVTIHASLESPKEAITEVEKSANVKFGYEGQTMVFRDPAAKDAKAKK
jgi:ferric-dicitrate binding protein FerR (iron transport regulator)